MIRVNYKDPATKYSATISLSSPGGRVGRLVSFTETKVLAIAQSQVIDNW